MEKITLSLSKSIILLCGFLLSLNTYGQLSTLPNCAESFALDWSTLPTTSNQYNWPVGTLANTYTNVDGSGIDISVAFTGETNTFGTLGTKTPKVGHSTSIDYEVLDLYTTGLDANKNITITITFSAPIAALSFNMHHINASGANGDKFTITGLNTNGDTILPTFTDSETPSYTTNNTSGVLDAKSPSTVGNDAVVGINFSDSNNITSITFIWEDCSTCSPKSIHSAGLGNFSFCIPEVLGFDGADDYINRSAFLGGKPEVTMMSWIKLDQKFDGGEIMGQRNFRLYVDSDNHLKAFIKTNNAISISSSNSNNSLLKNKTWYHTALKYNGNSGTVNLYLNGNNVWSYTDDSLVGTTLNNEAIWNADHDFEIGRNTYLEKEYFEGSIYECRVYNKALTKNQLYRQINQEIENNYGAVRGTIIPQDIDGLSWNDLELYYKMSSIDLGYTHDDSNSQVNGALHNMRNWQDYSAPLPYTTKTNADGDWSNANNWVHGDVWDISNNVPESAIVQINGNMQINANVSTIGLIINNGSKLQINENSGLFNSWYLKLDGEIDLEGESQLIQTKESILDNISSGTLEIDQQGTADTFTYNYWASPVGASNNSTNNNSYKIAEVFTNVEFLTSGYNGTFSPVGISDYWIWKYTNKLGDNYASWQHVRSTGELITGEGFTMKGPGTGSVTSEQNYVFKGKPNNGDVSINVNAGSDYLIGNPYPSAIDAVQFILDNGPISTGDDININGTLYFWEHWGGDSHILAEYQGGYSTFTLAGGVPAASKGTTNPDISTIGTPTKIPGRYIPVAQGFLITAETNSTIKFNNDQRVFQIEEVNNDNNPAYKKTSKLTESSDTRMKLRIGFNSINTIHRQLLITVDEKASAGYDWGYDSKYIDTQVDDMYWIINNEKFTIQGINEINEQTIIPLGMHTKNAGFNSITIDELENVPSDLNIYLYDKELNIYHNLKQGKYETYLDEGIYLNRFEIAFSKPQSLGINDAEKSQIEVYFSNKKNSIIVNNPSSKYIETIEMLNILGQSLFKFQTDTNNNHIEYNATQIETGNYILKIDTEFGAISKKVLIK